MANNGRSPAGRCRCQLPLELLVGLLVNAKDSEAVLVLHGHARPVPNHNRGHLRVYAPARARESAHQRGVLFSGVQVLLLHLLVVSVLQLS